MKVPTRRLGAPLPTTMPLRFDAPWSRALTGISLLLAVVAAGLVWTGATGGALVLGAVVALAGALAVRGYAVGPGVVVVVRPGWETRLDLRGLDSVEADPDAMRMAWRTWGIGGPFAFVGRYRSGRTGWFTAYATDRDRSVVLRWPGRTVVVTPDDPEAFVAAVEAAAEAA